MAIPTRYSTFLNESLQKQQKYYPAVGLSKQKIYAAKSQQKYFLLVGIDISFVVTNYTHFPDAALICGYLQIKVLVYNQYGKYIFYL